MNFQCHVAQRDYNIPVKSKQCIVMGYMECTYVSKQAPSVFGRVMWF